MGYKTVLASDLIAKFKYALNNKWGYILNTAGELWTAEKQEARKNDRNADEMSKLYGDKWIGRTVADCSGLFSWAYHELGSYTPHGSNSMFKKYTTDSGVIVNKKKANGESLKPGCAVFKLKNETDYHHVGMYIGDNKVIEAKGTQYGVVSSTLSGWTHWGEMRYTKYDVGNDKGENGMSEVKSYETATVTADGGVNFRKSPNTGAAKLATIPKGTVIQAAKYDNAWSEVKYDGKTGYAMTQYLTYTAENNTMVNKSAALEYITQIESTLSALKTLLLS